MADEKDKELAFLEGRRAAQVTGQESQTIYNPYAADDDDQELYEAWEDGFNHDGDIRSEMIHWGV